MGVWRSTGNVFLVGCGKETFRLGRHSLQPEGGNTVNITNIYDMNYDPGSTTDAGLDMPQSRSRRRTSEVRRSNTGPDSWYDEDDWIDWR